MNNKILEIIAGLMIGILGGYCMVLIFKFGSFLIGY